METRKNNPFSLAVAENDYFNDTQEKIKVVNCKPDGTNCQSILAQINNNFLQSSYYHRSKDYRRAIEELESAFEGTFVIQSSTCFRCVSLFRTTITETLENYHVELKSLTTGIFKKKRLIKDYELAENLLKTFQSRQDVRHETKVIKLQDINEQNSGVFAKVSLGT